LVNTLPTTVNSYRPAADSKPLCKWHRQSVLLL
jgi:hypothetical protein